MQFSDLALSRRLERAEGQACVQFAKARLRLFPDSGAVSQLVESDSTGELSFECQNLANRGQATIKIAIWYQQTKPGIPSVQIPGYFRGSSAAG